MILVLFYLVFYGRWNLQPSGGHVQGKGLLIAGMAPDLSYMITHAASGWIFREWNENKVSRQYILLK